MLLKEWRRAHLENNVSAYLKDNKGQPSREWERWDSGRD